MKVIHKLAWLYFENRKVLFVRTRGKDLAYNVGGKKEEGESDEQCLIREVKEEVDVELIPSTIKYFHTFSGPSHGNESDTIVEMKCFSANFVGTLKPSSEIEELVWLASSDMDKTTLAGHKILDYLKEKDLII